MSEFQKCSLKVRPDMSSVQKIEPSTQAKQSKSEIAKKIFVNESRCVSTSDDKMNPSSHTNSPTSELPKSKHQEESTLSSSDVNLNHYDEIIDFEAMYSSSSLETLTNIQDSDSCSGIYESVDPWEKLQGEQTETEKCFEKETTKADSRSPPLPISENLDTAKHSNLKLKTNLLPIQEKALVSSGGSQDSLQSQEQGKPKKKKGLAGILQKFFRKDKDDKKKESTRRASTMVITGPVDLKGSSKKNGASENHKNGKPSKHITTSNANGANKNLPPPGSQNVNNLVLDELKSKVGQLKRANSELTPAAVAKSVLNEKSADQNSCSNLARRSTIQTLIPDKSDASVSAEEIRSKPIPPMTLLFQNSIAEYQQKLARFNRLSAHLNPSFVAMFKPNPVNLTVGQIGRSSSCKIKSDNPPPALPPKKKKVPTRQVNAYDYPTNNTPVVKTRSKSHALPRGIILSKSPTLRELAKKNSAPEIMFKSSKLSGSSEILPFILKQTFEMSDSPSKTGSPIPPPRPPKKNFDWTIANYSDEDFVNNEGSDKNGLSHKQTPEEMQKQSTGQKSQVLLESPHTNNENIQAKFLIVQEQSLEKHGMPQEVKGTAKYANISFGPTNQGISETRIVAEKQVQSKKNDKSPTESLQNFSKVDPTTELETEKTLETVRPISANLSLEISNKNEPSSQFTAEIQIVRSQINERIESTSLTLLNTELQTSSPSGIHTTPTKSPLQENAISTESTIIASPVQDEIIELPTAPTCQIQEDNPKILPNLPENISVPKEQSKLLQNQIHEIIKPFSPSTTSPESVSPTSSNKSFDIDNLDVLSDLSDGSATQVEIPSMSTNDESCAESLPEIEPVNLIPVIPETRKFQHLTIEAIYENVKYATINTLVTEFEVVEEYDDEMMELYDEFPAGVISTIPPMPTPVALVLENNTPAARKNQTSKIQPIGESTNSKNGIQPATNISHQPGSDHASITKIKKGVLSTVSTNPNGVKTMV